MQSIHSLFLLALLFSSSSAGPHGPTYPERSDLTRPWVVDDYCKIPLHPGEGDIIGENPPPSFPPRDDYPAETWLNAGKDGDYGSDEKGHPGHEHGHGGHGHSHGGGKVLKYDLNISQFPAAPDGYTREIYGVNGQYPGPPIILNKGDRASIRVKNNIEFPTSIHAHGMHQRGTPWYDGVTGTTQCPIPSNDTFTYEIDTAYQSGTTWYHSHTSAQYVDGIVGPLIIRDPEDPNKHLYDEELVIVLTDWWHTLSSKLLRVLLSPEGSGNVPTPDAGLINGKGRFNCTKLAVNNITMPEGQSCFENAPREKFHFVPGRRYRLRIINASGDTNYHFSIDGHRLTVIETDMIPVKPHTIDRLSIHVAQRYSVVVEAKEKVDNYWMRAEMMTTCYRTQNPILDPLVLAEVRYDGSGPGEPTSQPSAPTPSSDVVTGNCEDLDFRSLAPVVPQKAKFPTKQLIFNITFNPDDLNITRAFMNNKTYDIRPYNPILKEVIQGRTVLPPRENAYFLEKDEVVEVVLNNLIPGTHPFHLHGHDFQVLSWVNSTFYDPIESPKLYNLDNPIRRDTSTVPGPGHTVLRFRADNPGVWAFHCHLEWHLQMGLVANLVEQPKVVSTFIQPLTAGRLCDAPQVPVF